MFGQAFAVYKLVSSGVKLACKVGGATEKVADNTATYAGAYVAYFAAFITADPIGAAGVAIDIGHKIVKRAEEPPE